MKPATKITDRAKRYRANALVPEGPKVCMMCGSTSDLGVDHLDGFEENLEPENLWWLCRSCNQLKSAVYLEHGMGRRTVQYNPGFLQRLFGPKETYRVHGAAHPEARRERAQEAREAREREREEIRKDRAEARARRAAEPQAVGRYKGFTLYRGGPAGSRYFYSTMDPDSWLDSTSQVKRLIDTFKNPAAGLSAWRNAVAVLRGDKDGSPFAAARVVRSTPVSRRYRYLDQTMRMNPSSPSFQQYAWAVAHHTRGAIDEGGAVIHATPKAKRKEYAERIAETKRSRGTAYRSEVPF